MDKSCFNPDVFIWILRLSQKVFVMILDSL